MVRKEERKVFQLFSGEKSHELFVDDEHNFNGMGLAEPTILRGIFLLDMRKILFSHLL